VAEMTTKTLMALIESYGYQFLKDKAGWACYDVDTRLEVPSTRHPRLGVVWMANDQLKAWSK
jgi:hypothetical protein